MANARYQHDHIEKVPRSSGGFAWKYRFRQTDPDGKRRLKSITFVSDEYPTEASVWTALENQMGSINEGTREQKVGYTWGQLIARYKKDELPKQHGPRNAQNAPCSNTTSSQNGVTHAFWTPAP